ncbi:MAG TPA: hypothetical protein VK158_03620, partial [Acidobacteriota bacterium]|nr:hypothetical protein [Acidobacteriota bacterium]
MIEYKYFSHFHKVIKEIFYQYCVKQICVIGGGGGVSKLFGALAPYVLDKKYALRAIISMADNG